MRFVKTRQRRSINRTVLNMSSMIDVTFLLLVYFIITTVLTPPEDELTPALQVEQGTQSNAQDYEPQIVEVRTFNAQQVYQIGDQILQSRAELALIFRQLPHEPGVIIRVEDTVTVGFAIAAVQEARSAGFERVTYVPASR